MDNLKVSSLNVTGFIQFDMRHLGPMMGRLRLAATTFDSVDDVIDTLDCIKDRSILYTAVYNGCIMAVGGITFISKNVGHGVLIGTRDIDKHKAFFYRNLKRHLHQIINHCNLHRVQCDLRCIDSQYIKFFELLGFENEGVMRQYNDRKEDYYRFSLIRD